MTNCYVVVEGEIDAAILSKVLGERLKDGAVGIKVGRGRSSAISLARTMLVSRPDALTVLVLDADSTDQERIDDMEAELEGSLADVSRRERFGVYLLAPSIEACLFRDLDGLQRFFKSNFSAEQVVESRYNPKLVIQTKLNQRGEKYNARTIRAVLDNLDVQRLQTADGIRELLRFVANAAVATTA